MRILADAEWFFVVYSDSAMLVAATAVSLRDKMPSVGPKGLYVELIEVKMGG